MHAPPKHSLLVVDDEPDVCDSVYHLLRRQFHVLRAGSAAEGCRLMQEHEVHIIMTDQRMPRITGVELLTKVRSRYPYAVRMLFTGFADLEAIIGAINDGHVFAFLRKPWEPEELEQAVQWAAAEYDRLVANAEELNQLKAEVAQLRDRVGMLEAEITRLVSVLAPAHRERPKTCV